jgi:mRNA m6A methyltransferase catalytic subunit
MTESVGRVGLCVQLPYGTMSDEEMLALPLGELVRDGFIFLWVTGRALEVGRACLQRWG